MLQIIDNAAHHFGKLHQHNNSVSYLLKTIIKNIVVIDIKQACKHTLIQHTLYNYCRKNLTYIIYIIRKRK